MPPSPGGRPLFARTPWYYGWTIVIVCSLILLIAFGIRLSFTVFFVALITEFGWSRADTSLIFSVSMIVFMLGSIVTGIGLDRFGARIMFGCGGLLLAAGLFLASRITTFPQIVFAYGILAGLGITILGLGQQAAVIARWFRRRLGLAIGIAFAGTGLGSLLIIPTVSTLVDAAGWRSAMVVLAGLALLTVPPAVLLLRLEPSSLGLSLADEPGLPRRRPGRSRPATLPSERHWTVRQALVTPPFWLLLLAAAGTTGPVRLLTVHQLALMADAGFSTTTGAQVVGVGGMITALTFILAGGLSDVFGRTTTYALGGGCLLAALGLLGALKGGGSTIQLWAYAVLFGIGEGSRSSLVAAVAGDLFRGPSLGMINGAVGSAFGAGAALFPWLAGRIYDGAGSYTVALWLAGLTIVISAVALYLAARRVPHINRVP